MLMTDFSGWFRAQCASVQTFEIPCELSKDVTINLTGFVEPKPPPPASDLWKICLLNSNKFLEKKNVSLVYQKKFEAPLCGQESNPRLSNAGTWQLLFTPYTYFYNKTISISISISPMTAGLSSSRIICITQKRRTYSWEKLGLQKQGIETH